ncbi:Na/Pi symporter [Clostridiaceae bacterium 35-E11]
MLISIFIGTILGMIIFFTGMIMITHSTTALSGQKLKRIVAFLTTHPVFGIFVGIIVTGLTQSSSGTSVLVVSLVNSGVMNLYQATGVIMGANIGTTITGQLVTFNIFEMIPPILMLGILLFYLNMNPLTKHIGKFFIGFSFLFFGMKIMSYFLTPLKDLMHFKSFMLSIEQQQFKGIVLGAITTALIQSSSTGIALVQGLASKGLINIYQAIPILMGQNIGTCTTSLFSSIAADKNGKRAAFIHLLFNIIGVFIFYPFIGIFSNFILHFTPLNAVKQIANAHSFFNIINALILFPFIPFLVFLSKKIIR